LPPCTRAMQCQFSVMKKLLIFPKCGDSMG